MSPLTIANAEKVYQRDTVARTAYNPFPKAVLQELCEKKGIFVVNTGLRSNVPMKADYIQALHFFHRQRMTQDVEIEMSTDGPFAGKEAGPQSFEVNEVMEPEPHSQPAGTLVEEGDLAASSLMELDETETLPSALTPSLRIRLYKDAKAWHYLREILFRRDLAGNINLCELKTELAVDGQLYVLDPRRHRPFFEYTPGILHADDLDALLDNGFLQVTDRLA